MYFFKLIELYIYKKNLYIYINLFCFRCLVCVMNLWFFNVFVNLKVYVKNVNLGGLGLLCD